MTFLDRARAATIRKGPQCSFGSALAVMEPAYRAEVVATMSDPTVAATIIVNLLNEDGIEVGADSVRRHRNRMLNRPGGCTCETGA